MRALIQRVNRACVFVNQKRVQVGKISKGYFILVGVGRKDSFANAEKLADKISKIRLMPDEKGKINLDLKNSKGEVLVVSQFTLYGDASEGNRPSFINAADPSAAEEIYNFFLKELEKRGLKIKTGKFGEYMNIDLELDGPVTIYLEN